MLKQEPKYVKQRGKRGFADCDCWSTDFYLSQIIPQMIKKIKDNKQGLPCSLFPNALNITEKQEIIAQKKWDIILDNIIYTFITAQDIIDSNLFYCPIKHYNNKKYKELRKRFSKLKHIRIMSYQECKCYEKGWELFQEYFFSLWT